MQAEALGITGKVRFGGHRANPFPSIAAADAFVLSSRFEGFPNVVLEALTCGTPVIALPSLGGTSEILQQIPECVLAESVSAHALARAILDWLARPLRRVPASAVAPYDVGYIVGQYARALEGP